MFATSGEGISTLNWGSYRITGLPGLLSGIRLFDLKDCFMKNAQVFVRKIMDVAVFYSEKVKNKSKFHSEGSFQGSSRLQGRVRQRWLDLLNSCEKQWVQKALSASG